MSRFQYLPLSDDQEFETFIRDLYRAKEGADDYSLYRVSGAAQHGTDVYSLRQKTAIQCKCHVYNKKGPDAWQKTAAKELRAEFEEFKGHPRYATFERFIFCTTLPKGTLVEQEKDKIQEELIASGSTLTVYYRPWEEIEEVLERHPELIEQYGFRRIKDILLSPLALITDLKGFVGREEELKAIEERLQEDIPTSLVRGMGGMGKTTLAKAYVWQALSKYHKVIWLTLDQPYPQALLQDTWLHHKLGIPVKAGMQEDFIMHRFREKLESMEGRNLLVLDNASNATMNDSHKEALPQRNWHILLTSREEIEGFSSYPIEHLLPAEAIQLFRQHYSGADSDKDIKALLVHIGYHTLTTELLAKTLQKSTLSNTAALLAKLKDQSLNSPQVNKKIRQHYSKEESTLMTILSQAFTLQDLNADEVQMLQWFSCFPPQTLSLDEIAQVMQWDDDAKDEGHDTIQSLVEKGWIEQVERFQFRFHRLLTELIPLLAPPDWNTLEPLVIGIANCVYYDQHNDNPVDYFHWLPWSGHLIACTKDLEEASLIDLLDNHGILLLVAGNYQGAKSALLNALTLAEELLAPEGPDLNRLQSNLALVHQDLGEYEEAKALLTQALAGDIAHYGEEHPEVQTTRSNLATVHKDLGEYAEAKALFEQVLEAKLSHYGEEHPSVQITRSNLATVHRALGEYTEAKGLLEQALAGGMAHFGEAHPEVQIRRSNLAAVYHALGEYTKANAMLRQALAGDIAHFGEAHPTVQISRSNLAIVYQALGEYTEAKALLEQVLEAELSHYGEKHPTVAITLNNLALVHEALGEMEEAKAAWRKAFAILLASLGPEHPHTQIVMAALEQRGWLP